MLSSGRGVFGEMDEVVFGRPAAEAVAEQVGRLGATRIFLMVSGTMNRSTDECSTRTFCRSSTPGARTACCITSCRTCAVKRSAPA